MATTLFFGLSGTKLREAAMGSMQGEARIHIDAQAEEIYDLVADVTHMGDWSPETRSAEWIGESKGPAVGAEFAGRNQDQKWRWAKWTGKCKVTVADRGKEFTFVRGGMGTTTWSYRFESDDSGTTVVEHFDCPKYPLIYNIVMPVRKREPTMVQGMEQTLDRLKASVEST